MTFRLMPLGISVCAALYLLACNSSPPSEPTSSESDSVTSESDTAVQGTTTDSIAVSTDQTSTVQTSTVQNETLKKITDAYSASRTLTTAQLLSEYPAQTSTALDYAPLNSMHLDLIQSSTLSLNDSELNMLSRNGFVIAKRLAQNTMFHGYAEIYKEDLPVYISADAILDSVHRSFDTILMTLENQILIFKLDTLLSNLRDDLVTTPHISADTKVDLDLYLTVAHSLLLDELQPNSIAPSDKVSKLFTLAKKAEGMEDVALFGKSREMDFSQFTPRGHYDDSPRLAAYFRAMMWLGRIDFRLIETDGATGIQTVNRSQIMGTLALGTLMGPYLQLWQQINRVIELFVGVSDNMTPMQIETLMNALGISQLSELDGLSDEQVKNVILSNSFGTQRIASHLITNGLNSGTLPLNASFLIFGQRFTIDSFVFSNLVYDRVMEGTIKRMMPSPLDVAFAVLNNNQAAVLLQPELAQYPYAPDLHMMRTIVKTYDDDFWNANLYNLWLKSLTELTTALPAGMPSVTQTKQWETRLLNTQLGSWAELRHDTILYAKQSYTSGATCEFPDAYVDPYPAFFDGLAAYADKGLEIADVIDADISNILVTQVLDYFTELAFVSEILGEMAQQQLDGIPHSAAQLGFINDAVQIGYEPSGCASIEVAESGWYERLFFDKLSAVEYDPTIADVHTQPTDAGGNTVGKVLHVATGNPRPMVVTVNQCGGPKAYVGMVFSYYEKVTENFVRLTDNDWSNETYYEPYLEYAPDDYVPPEDIPWMGSIVAK